MISAAAEVWKLPDRDWIDYLSYCSPGSWDEMIITSLSAVLHPGTVGMHRGRPHRRQTVNTVVNIVDYSFLPWLLPIGRPWSLGCVENGNQRVFKNLLAFLAAIWYINLA